jgi:hypothetical protein
MHVMCLSILCMYIYMSCLDVFCVCIHVMYVHMSCMYGCSHVHYDDMGLGWWDWCLRCVRAWQTARHGRSILIVFCILNVMFAAEDKADPEEEGKAEEQAEEDAAAAQAVAKLAAPVQDDAKMQTLYEGSKSSRVRGELAGLGLGDAHVRRGYRGRRSSGLEQRLASEERQADSAMARIKKLTAGI